MEKVKLKPYTRCLKRKSNSLSDAHNVPELRQNNRKLQLMNQQYKAKKMSTKPKTMNIKQRKRTNGIAIYL